MQDQRRRIFLPGAARQFNTAQVHSAVLVAVSAGRECEDEARGLWQEGKPDEYFFMEMYGSAVVEHLVAVANGRLCAWADRKGWRRCPITVRGIRAGICATRPNCGN